MTIIELITALSAFDGDSVDMAAKAAVQANIAGAKDVYLAWGKSIGISAKNLETAWKEAQPEKASSGPRGFADIYYDWLAEAAREEQEAHDYIMASESQNVKNHLTHYLNIWALCETVRQGRKVVRTISAGKAPSKKSNEEAPKGATSKEKPWEYDAANPYADVRSAKETLKREMAKPRPAKVKVHPDKVAFLNDDELTALYNAAFQSLNKKRS